MSPSQNKHSHVHFGAGALTIGLVLPLVNKTFQNLVIFQRKSDEEGKPNDWRRLRRSRHVTFHNSQEYNEKISVFYDEERVTNEQIEKKYEEHNYNEIPLLIITDDRNKYKIFIENANSISCSLKDGQDDLVKVLGNIKLTPNIPFFPFENSLSKSIRQFKGVDVIEVVPDRISFKGGKIDKSSITVIAEKSGKVYINSEAKNYSQLFAGSDDVKIFPKKDPRTFRFYYERKKRLVNGIHYALTTASYKFLSEISVPADLWGKQYLTIIQDILLSKTRGYLPHIYNYIDGQIMYLILNFRDEIMNEFPALKDDEDIFDKLRFDAENMFKRTSNQLDPLQRILDIEDRKKTISSLSKFQEFFSDFHSDIEDEADKIDSLHIRRRPFSRDITTSLKFLNDWVVYFLTEKK